MKLRVGNPAIRGFGMKAAAILGGVLMAAVCGLPMPCAAAGGAKPAAALGETILGTSKDVETSQEVFAPDTPRIVLNAELRNVANGAVVRGEWIAEKTDVAPANYMIDGAEIKRTPFVNVAHFSISRPDAGWPVGAYRVDVFVSGKLAKSVRFRVAE